MRKKVSPRAVVILIVIVLGVTCDCDYDYDHDYDYETTAFLDENSDAGNEMPKTTPCRRNVSAGKDLDAFLRNLEVSERRAWEKGVRRIKTVAEFRRWARSARKWLIAGHGGFPERTPLRPKAVGVIRRRGYRIEKILFESRPRYFVPGLIYVPERSDPLFPGVVWACGHYPEGKAHPDYERMAALLALKGFVVCAVDPFGQGERGEYVDFESGLNVAGCPVGSHHFACKPSLLLGRNAIHYRSWDKIRAIDILCSRPDVDKRRVGFGGHSGGGQMAYLMCGLDDRVKAAAISSGSGSCEHPHFRPRVSGPLHVGDNLDYAAPFIPKPLMIMIGEAETVYRERLRKHEHHFSRFYRLFGKRDHFKVVMNAGEHDLDRARRQLICDWFIRWLNPAQDPREGEVAPLQPARLRCTRTGNTLTSLKTETVVSLNTKAVKRRAAQRRVPQTRGGLTRWQKQFRGRLRQLLALPRGGGRLASRTLDVYSESGWRIEKLSFVSERGRRVPATLHMPAELRKPCPTVVFIDDRGKDAASVAAQELCGLGHGVAVLSLDVAGIGEAAPPPSEITRDHPMLSSPETNLATRALDVGRPLIGLRVNDVLRAVDYVEQRRGLDPKRVLLFGIGSGALCAACAGALDGRVAAVSAADLLISYATMVEHRFTSGTYPADFTPGILKHGDICDILACIAPRPLAIFGARDHRGGRAPKAAQRRAMAPVKRAYRLLDSVKSFEVWTGAADQRRWSVLMAGRWISGLLDRWK